MLKLYFFIDQGQTNGVPVPVIVDAEFFAFFHIPHRRYRG